jgi:hypothetical protein
MVGRVSSCSNHEHDTSSDCIHSHRRFESNHPPSRALREGGGFTPLAHADAIGWAQDDLGRDLTATEAVSVKRRPDRAPTRGGATSRRAVRVAAITGDTDREDPMAEPAGFLAKRRVHVGAAVRSDWTYPEKGYDQVRRLPPDVREPGVTFCLFRWL